MKRGQITIFIILAIMIVMIFAILNSNAHYFANKGLTKKADTPGKECPVVGELYQGMYCGGNNRLYPLLAEGKVCVVDTQCQSRTCQPDESEKTDACPWRNREGDWEPGYCGRCA